MVETLAELPFIGDQVGLFRAQPGRPASYLPTGRSAVCLSVTTRLLLLVGNDAILGERSNQLTAVATDHDFPHWRDLAQLRCDQGRRAEARVSVNS